MTDDDVVRWYAQQQLPPAAVDRLRRASAAGARRRWGMGLAAIGAVAIAATWALWPRPTPPLTAATPIAYLDALPIPDEPVRAPVPLELPPGTARTEVVVRDGTTLSQVLTPGNLVDVLVADGVDVFGLRRSGDTTTVLQAVAVLDIAPPSSRVGLLVTPDQRRRIDEASLRGEIVLALRNELDPDYASVHGVDLRPLMRQIAGDRHSGRVVWPEISARPGSGDAEVHLTAANAGSTFALDVDTASYSLSRAELDRGRLPDPARVQVEAFVNAQLYDWPAPENGLFAASFEVVPSPWTIDYDLVRVGLRARIPATREPLHLTLLVDGSGSMASQLDLVRRTLDTLVDSLDVVDTVAVVRFSDAATIVLPPTPARDPSVRFAVAGLDAGGSTALQAGLVTAYGVAATQLREPGLHRVVLCTDGMPNVGDTEAKALSTSVQPWTGQGIGLTALGFGRHGHRDERMEAFADGTDDNYAYIDGVDEVPRVLATKVLQPVAVVARDAKVRIAWDPATVEGWRRIGDARALADAAFDDTAADAGEVGAGQQVTALYEVRRTGRRGALGTLTIRAHEVSDAPRAQEGQVAEQAFAIEAEAVPTLDQATPDTRLAVAAGSLGLFLAKSPLSELDPGRMFAIAQTAQRPQHSADDAALLAMIREASTATTPPPEPPTRCHDFTLILGGKREVTRVDDEGIPCRDPSTPPDGCHEFTLIGGGTRKVILVDDNGIPCEAPPPAKPPPPEPPKGCHEFTLINGGTREVILVDDDGIPCADRPRPLGLPEGGGGR